MPSDDAGPAWVQSFLASKLNVQERFALALFVTDRVPVAPPAGKTLAAGDAARRVAWSAPVAGIDRRSRILTQSRLGI